MSVKDEKDSRWDGFGHGDCPAPPTPEEQAAIEAAMATEEDDPDFDVPFVMTDAQWLGGPLMRYWRERLASESTDRDEAIAALLASGCPAAVARQI